MPTHVLFDLDNCLFVEARQVDILSAVPNNLTPIMFTHNNNPERYYAINLESMRIIMAELIRGGIRIGFITNGYYLEATLKPFLEAMFLLAPGTLANSVYIHGNDYTACDSCKALKLLAAQKDGRFPRPFQPDEILVVDDLPKNIDDLKRHGFRAIHACGFPMPSKISGSMPVNNDYLQQIVLLCGLQVTLPVLEPLANDMAIKKVNTTYYYTNSDRYREDAKVVGLHEQTLKLIAVTKNFLKINKILGTIDLRELSVEDLEFALHAVVFSEHERHYARWLAHIKDLYMALSAKKDWKNYKLIINGANLWRSLDAKFCYFVMKNGRQHLHSTLEIWRDAHGGKFESEQQNVALAIELETAIGDDAWRYTYWNDSSAIWAFIAEYWRLDDKEHTVFNYSPAKGYRSINTQASCAAIIAVCLKHRVLETAARYMNAVLLLQILAYKYYNRVNHNDFLPTYRLALKTLVQNENYSSQVKGEAISLILDYLHTYWVAWDERTLYKDLKRYVQEQIVLEPELARYINVYKHGITIDTKLAQTSGAPDDLCDVPCGSWMPRF